MSETDIESIKKTTEELKAIEINSDDFKKLTQQERVDAYSYKLFNKPAKELKYIYVTNFIHQQLIAPEEKTRTGLYQWQNVFNGDVKYPRDILDYNEYDIVQCNMSAQDLHLVNTIKGQIRPDSKTKLVLNNDYTTEMWGSAFEYLSTVERELQGADMLFGTEYFQTTALEELSGRKCFIIPHPADIRRLKSLPKIQPKNILSVIWRRYDKFSYIPALVARNNGLVTQLIGFDKNQDPKVYVTTTLFDRVLAATDYFGFTDQMRESKVVYDPFTFHSYSRSTVDTAGLGIPAVVSNRTQSGNVCYPYTTVDPYDVKTARILIKKLIDDPEFRKLVIETAYKNCEYYNHENSRERYLAALYEGSPQNRGDTSKPVMEKGYGDDVLNLISQDMNRNAKKK